MHLVFWVGVTLLSVSCIEGTPEMYQRQAKLREQLKVYEIVTPTRVTEFGEPFPNTMHFRRRKRSVDTDHWAFVTHYRISAFGQFFHLNLTADSGFIAPIFTVTHLGIQANLTDFHEKDTDTKHCYYTGQVNAKPEHTAVISLCSGLLGTFRSHDGEYFVEPLVLPDGEEYDEEHNKPHLVYKQDALKTQTTREVTNICGNSGHKHSQNKNKRKWSKGLSSNILSDLDNLENSITMHNLAGMDNNTTGAGIHKRTKRFLSYPRYVEVMVVADSRMVEHHGANLQHYVLTLMSIVATIYKDPSIGNLINIVVVKLIIINSEQEGPSISFNAQTTLKNFCIWQQKQNNPDENHHSHHDTAVLITRQDICRARDKCDTLGLAELGTVCDPYRSCSISEDNGLSTAFTIAHELGHVFNMPHDDSNKCKEDGGKNQQHVMAPTLNYYTNPWMWSKCSRRYVTNFLDTGYGECLLDEPVTRTYTLPHQLPGQIYNVDKQCELIFGSGSQVCPYMTQCRRLWCTSTEGVQRGCRTQHMPWADGTECEPGKHCKHGICIVKDPAETSVVDGTWGPWSPFGSCSRTCGGGIKNAVRECNKPEPRNGGKYCVGRRMKFRSCNTEHCPKQEKDFRGEQCAQFDGRHFNINGLPPNVRWVPKYSGILMKDRCKLFCRVAGTTVYYQLRDRVIDGTLCGPDTNDVCVQGLCRQAGCDHVLNSKARRDKCGVCGGDNSSCKTLAGTFNIVHYGYNVVVQIPIGATNIDVRQHSHSGKPEDDNYLALANSRGEFLLNGDFVVSMFKREIKVRGAVIEYSGSDNGVERINCTDRIEEELIVQVLSVGNLYNPDVRYSFNIPIEDKVQRFFWDQFGPWQDCNRLCQGERKRRPICTRESDRLVVSDQRCDQIPRPTPLTESCNTECEIRWHIARKSECTAQCGPGYRTLDIYCAKYSQSEGKTEKIDERYCSYQPKPDNKEVCHGDCNVGGWQYSSWSECSKSCGGGSRRRNAVCVNSMGTVLGDNKCSQQEKMIVQRCNEYTCPVWKTGEWSECLVTCGKGYKHRQTWCQVGEEQLDNGFCNSATKPASAQACQQQECAAWQVGPWGQCTATCGTGYQMRAVRCIAGSYGTIVNDNECNAATRPTDTEDCELASCPDMHPGRRDERIPNHMTYGTEWRFGSWTPCSATCGKGTKERYVSCRDLQGGVADESACSHLSKPPSREECIVIPCGRWKTHEWTQCSVTCGQGKATRHVSCMNYKNQIVSESECDLDDQPLTEQECAMPSCTPRRHGYDRSGQNDHLFPRTKILPTHGDSDRTQRPGGSQWRTGPWGACSSTCAGGFQRRVVVCQDEDGYDTNNCAEQAKPVEMRSCESGPCPQWIYGNWGECTQLCGGGARTRLVICQLQNGQRLSDQNCEILDKPPDREQCNTRACPTDDVWHRGRWSSCSISCGKGSKYRTVYCMTKDGKEVEEENCKHLERPKTHKRCRGGRCPKWKTGDWAQCSALCGSGIQQREVFCQIANQSIEDSHCSQSTKPASIQRCQTGECLHYSWHVEEWQKCSKTCGTGTRNRKVTCINQNSEEVYNIECDARKRPLDVEQCNTQPCEYIWITGEWSECSVTCGNGYQQRLVSCSEVYNGKDLYEYGYYHQITTNCPGTQPPNIRACTLGECHVTASWRVGNWGSCSVTCGIGAMQRSVHCLTNDGHLSNLCSLDIKPEERRTCQSGKCEFPESCRDVQRLKGFMEDGDHFLNIQGKRVKIYCAGMLSDSPREYITLESGDAENFSEVYGYRLHNPAECPYNGSRRDDCQCRRDYLAAGFSTFSKVRLDINTLQIITTDLYFAQTLEGRSVPFATAGDCYSAARCPQGQFSINLSGTGLRVSESTRWISQGNYAVVEIQWLLNGAKVTGKCGGYCGKCIPYSGTGLHVQLL
ncbi:A disintegrin and metalloproteinase with thrombospondin motifs 9-like isoform X1 [Carcharodon carcharias]|uniref:A disintegrin and metalloproteinase with thrombospondin motifs 9-like isoform X1 n=1 Tax=Carcharodon carcharias TaxID=13397 RepID=UPI001B7EF544|nr:A disintegrin and metalloproteinase with thrombospondin motifs 9-like isoform X1 [Carcharodon carcharias]